MTRNFAIIPVKGLLDSKSRLSSILGPVDKKQLILAMLKDVLATVEKSEIFNRVLVVSLDRNVEREGKLREGVFLHQELPGLNAGIRQSTLFAMKEDASSATVLLGDIPLVEPRDLKEVCSMGDTVPRVVLSPSQKGGTNVMLRHPPYVISSSYGRWSFSNHLRSAQRTGVAAYAVSNPRLSFDVDTPDDLVVLRSRDPKARTNAVRCLQEMNPIRAIQRN